MNARVKLMERRWTKWLAGLLGIAGVAYAGYFIGFNMALQENYFNNLFHTANYITALNHIHQNKLENASNSLELNLSVGVLSSPSENALLLPRTREMVEKTLGKVKAYRIKHPWQSGKAFDKNVEDALSKVVPEEVETCP